MLFHFWYNVQQSQRYSSSRMSPSTFPSNSDFVHLSGIPASVAVLDSIKYTFLSKLCYTFTYSTNIYYVPSLCHAPCQTSGVYQWTKQTEISTLEGKTDNSATYKHIHQHKLHSPLQAKIAME